ncbi:MAG: antiterminator LoaP [Spirochaetales bacterium]|nr:antiterminator LoaP [Spirochaetales bacterium]
MYYYVIQVRSRREEKYLARARELAEGEVDFFWPRRELCIRKRGVWRETVAPVFPGYIFFAAPDLPVPLYRRLKAIPDFTRFLNDNRNVTPLSGRDLELVRHFLGQGDIVRKSLVSFEADQRIRILEGPLKGLEGMIVKVDKRKKRIKVRLELYSDSFSIDFGFESVENSNGADGGHEDRFR